MSEQTCGWTRFGRAWYTSRQPSINLGSSTVVRVVDSGGVDPEFKPRPVGFTAKIEPVDPLVWEGDGA